MPSRIYSCLFLEKTNQILQNPEYSSIISWDADGQYLRILNQKALAEVVLPVFFKHNKVESFARQLNMYGFRKVKKSISENSFIHKEFKRETVQTSKEIKRRVNSKRAESIEEAPNSNQHRQQDVPVQVGKPPESNTDLGSRQTQESSGELQFLDSVSSEIDFLFGNPVWDQNAEEWEA